MFQFFHIKSNFKGKLYIGLFTQQHKNTLPLQKVEKLLHFKHPIQYEDFVSTKYLQVNFSTRN